MPNNPSDLPSTIAGALKENRQLGPGGDVYGAWWEGTAAAMAATVATNLGILQTQCCYGQCAVEVKNTGATNAFTAFKIQVLATPNGDFVDYITSAQLHAGTAIQGIFNGVVGDPTLLALSSNALILFQLNGVWAVQFIATSTAGTTGQILASGRRFG